MRTLALSALALILALPSSGASLRTRCQAGRAQAFIALQSDPSYLVGTIPSSFTADARFFVRRYNCRRQSALVRRVGLGIYQVRFPGLSPRAVLSTAISDEGVTSSVTTSGDVVQVSLRGPLGGSDVASRRDVPFSLVVY